MQAATRDYQRAQVALRAQTYSDVAQVWPLLNPARLDETFTVFAAVMLQVIAYRRSISVLLGRTYLQEMRQGLPGDVPAVDETPVDVNAVLGTLRVVATGGIKTAIGNGVALDLALRNGLVRTMGAADKFVNDGARELIRATVDKDPFAEGWSRVTLGTCDYCREKAGDHGPDFPRHDHCGCVPEPNYPEPLSGSEAEQAVFDAFDPVPFDELTQTALRYSGSAYRRINRTLRAAEPLDSELQGVYDAVQARAQTVPTAVNVFRGADRVSEWMGDAPIGSEVVDRGFVSSAFYEDAAQKWAGAKDSVVIEIRVPAGTRAMMTDQLHGLTQPGGTLSEHELVLLAGTRFRVVNDEIRDGIEGPVRTLVFEVIQSG